VIHGIIHGCQFKGVYNFDFTPILNAKQSSQDYKKIISPLL
jgi:hypothetical protein